MTRVKITDTVLRDAHQSLLATRLKTEDMLPIAEKLDAVGYFSLEVWGGATFDACLRFLNEDPWERLRVLRKHIRKTPLQMLLRGQNLVGYRHYPDDVVEKFVVKAAEDGIAIFRIFDALNDIRNLEVAIKVAKRCNAHVQGAICYTISPVHTIESYVRMAKKLQELNVDSICIKDMAGLISPTDAERLVRELKKEISLHIQLHTHYTSGMGTASYLKAVEVGVDGLDTAISSMALSTSQPPTETIVAMLKNTPHDTGLDLNLLAEIAAYFAEVRKKYSAFETQLGIDTNVLRYQIPGGMISNLVSQLREQNAMARYEEVLKEVPRVRAELGYPPLVTPTSQIVGTQAVFNVLIGERYKVVPNEVKLYVSGYYGRPPGQIDTEVAKKILGKEQPITCRPADMLKPEFERLKKELNTEDVELILSHALFPQVAAKFFSTGQHELVAATAIAVAVMQQSNASKKSIPLYSSAWTLAGRRELHGARLAGGNQKHR